MSPAVRRTLLAATAVGLLASCAGGSAPDAAPSAPPPSAAVAGPAVSLEPSASGGSHEASDTVGLGDSPIAVANLGVRDQTSDGRSVSLVAEISGTPGWVVISRDDAGRPGAVVGMARRLNGEHGDVLTVALRTRVTGGRYWASLHRDLGRQRVYEFPGPDEVVTAAGSALVRSFVLTVR